VRGPDFLIIGAARSGSTTLVHHLSLHPKIYIPKTDVEPKFFSREQEYAKGTEFYLATYFPLAEGYSAVGEKSTEYMENQSSAGRIYRFSPDMKLICILRDPLERAISNYWWSVHNGVEYRPLNEAIEEEWKKYMENPAKILHLTSSRPHAYIDRSLYYDNLKPFFDLFPGEHIKCLLFEDFVERGTDVIRDIISFLGLSPDRPTSGNLDVQRAVRKRESLDPELGRRLRKFLHEKNRDLSALIGINVWRFWDRQ